MKSSILPPAALAGPLEYHTLEVNVDCIESTSDGWSPIVDHKVITLGPMAMLVIYLAGTFMTVDEIDSMKGAHLNAMHKSMELLN